MKCLSFYGTEGALILSTVLERELNTPDSISYALSALGNIRERSVITTVLQLIQEKTANREDAQSASSSTKLKPGHKRQAIEILARLALTAFDEPNPQIIHEEGVTETGDHLTRIIILGETTILGENYFISKGVRPTQSDAMKVITVLKTIKESQHPSMTKDETLLVQVAAKGLKKIEDRIALLAKYGAKPKQETESEN